MVFGSLQRRLARPAGDPDLGGLAGAPTDEGGHGQGPREAAIARDTYSRRIGRDVSEHPHFDPEVNPPARDGAGRAGSVDGGQPDDGPEDDRARLRVLFTRHHTELCTFARRYVDSDDAARDLVQEIFFRVWRLRHDRSLASIERAYLYRAVRNEALNRTERRRSRREALDAVRPRTRKSMTGPEEDFERRRMRERVREAVAALPPRCREIFLLVRHDGLTYREAADTLDLSPSTIDTQMGRALKKLRDHLAGVLDEG